MEHPLDGDNDNCGQSPASAGQKCSFVKDSGDSFPINASGVVDDLEKKHRFVIDLFILLADHNTMHNLLSFIVGDNSNFSLGTYTGYLVRRGGTNDLTTPVLIQMCIQYFRSWLKGRQKNPDMVQMKRYLRRIVLQVDIFCRLRLMPTFELMQSDRFSKDIKLRHQMDDAAKGT